MAAFREHVNIKYLVKNGNQVTFGKKMMSRKFVFNINGMCMVNYNGIIRRTYNGELKGHYGCVFIKPYTWSDTFVYFPRPAVNHCFFID